MEACVGVDIGGSGVRAAVVHDGRVGEPVREVLVDRTVETVVDTVARAVAPLNPRAVGVGVPGYVHEGIVLGSPNFPVWRGVPFGPLLEARLGVPVRVENDANVAALGAWRERGGTEDLVMLTLGTGVGGGVVSAGELLLGARGTGAELGHVYAGGEQPCGCGGVGCLETWCGTSGMARRALALGQPVKEGRDVVDAADRGEAWAVELMADAAMGLGRGLVTLVNIFNPDVVLIAGGLAAARTWLGGPAEDWLRRHAVGPSADHVRIEWEGRADRFAILGAAELARGA